MVRRLDRAAARLKRRCRRQPLHVGPKGRLPQPLEDLPDIEGSRIHGVVGPGVADFPVHVQALGRHHGARCGQSLPRGLREEPGRIEGRRRRLPSFVTLHARDDRGVRKARQGDRGVCAANVPERTGHRGALERRITQRRGHVPEWPRDEVFPFSLPLRDEPEGRGLDSAGGEELSIRAAFERQETREHGAPCEIDPLAGRRGLSQRPIRLHEMFERPPDFARRHRTESRPARGHVRALGPNRLEGFDPDEFAFPIVVRGEHDLIDALREPTQRVVERDGRLAADVSMSVSRSVCRQSRSASG